MRCLRSDSSFSVWHGDASHTRIKAAVVAHLDAHAQPQTHHHRRRRLLLPPRRSCSSSRLIELSGATTGRILFFLLRRFLLAYLGQIGALLGLWRAMMLLLKVLIFGAEVEILRSLLLLQVVTVLLLLLVILLRNYHVVMMVEVGRCSGDRIVALVPVRAIHALVDRVVLQRGALVVLAVLLRCGREAAVI